MNIQIAAFQLTELDDGVEAHGRPQEHRSVRPAARLDEAGNVALDIRVEGGALTLVDTDDVEGHMWRRGRLVELGNDVVEVSDANGVVRRYVRVGGTPRRSDAVVLQYRSGAGPRF